MKVFLNGRSNKRGVSGLQDVQEGLVPLSFTILTVSLPRSHETDEGVNRQSKSLKRVAQN